MKAANLYILTRNQQKKLLTPYENVLSGREEVHKIKEHEFHSLTTFVDVLFENHITIADLDGFYFSYSIKYVGKEFDLLKVCKNEKVLNIELKSEAISLEKIEKQLQQNQYYLGLISSKIYSFTFVEETKKFYRLDETGFHTCKVEDLIQILKEFRIYETGEIEELFCAKDFLISPLNTPEKFIEHRYFLTQQQVEIKKNVLEQVENNIRPRMWGITGGAGTGKTLLLYDIAKECSRYGKCCVIHSGMLLEGHQILNNMMENVDIMSVKAIDYELLKQYQFIFVDEAQRLTPKGFHTILNLSENNKTSCIFFYDYFQVFTKAERKRNIPEKLKRIPGFQERRLSGKIRSNKEIVSFIETLLDLTRMTRSYKYNNIDLFYTETAAEAKNIIQYYREEKNYVYIEYANLKYYPNATDRFYGDLNAHHVIGQEFDNVVITLDKNFRYGANGKLQGRVHPNPNYLFNKLFYQAISRAREKLCIIVIGNAELFEKINSVKFQYIEGREES